MEIDGEVYLQREVTREVNVRLKHPSLLLFTRFFYSTVAASGHADGGEEDFANEARTADNVRLGDPRATRAPGCLRPPEPTICIFGQSYPQRRWPPHGYPRHRERYIQRIHVANSIECRDQRWESTMLLKDRQQFFVIGRTSSVF